MDSILEKKEVKAEKKERSLDDLFGIWANNPDADKMEEDILNGRVSNKTRHIVSFDEWKSILETFAEAKASLRKQGLLVDDFDLLIGSTAKHNNMIMVSENEKHLSRIPHIKIENWVER